jgi:lysozyme family protein
LIQDWDATIANILQWEGPEVNVSKDEPGGVSKYGVSLQTYTDFCKTNHLPVPTFDTINNFTADDASNFYKAYFASNIDFDDLPAGVDFRLMDIVVNLGMTGTHKLVSAVCDQWVPSTPTSIAGYLKGLDPVATINALSTGWISIKSTSPHWYVASPVPGDLSYGHGWTKRNIAQRTLALTMVGKTS